jgi:hypothetical protein
MFFNSGNRRSVVAGLVAFAALFPTCSAAQDQQAGVLSAQVEALL